MGNKSSIIIKDPKLYKVDGVNLIQFTHYKDKKPPTYGNIIEPFVLHLQNDFADKQDRLNYCSGILKDYCVSEIPALFKLYNIENPGDIEHVITDVFHLCQYYVKNIDV